MAKSIKLNAIFKTLMSIVNIVFPLLTAPYVARVLNIADFTEYNKVQSMLAWFSPFAVFGVYTYGMRTISQIKNDKDKVSKIFSELFFVNVITSVFVFIVFVCLIVFMPFSNGYKSVYLVMSLQILFVCFATDWANEAFESYGFILVKTFFCRLAYVIAVFLFVHKENDLIIYVILTTCSLMLNNFLTYVYAKRNIKFVKVQIGEITKLIKPLFIVFLLVNSSMLYTILDRFVLTLFGSKLDLTYYNMSQTLIVAITNVTSSIVLVSIPRLSNLWANSQKEEFYLTLRKTSSCFLALHIPCCIGFAVLSSEVMYFYGGINYIAGKTTLLLFSLRYYISAFDILLSKQILLSTGNEYVLTKIYYSGGILNVIMKVLLCVSNRLTPELCVITTSVADMLIIVSQILEIKILKMKIGFLVKANFKYLGISLSFIPIALCFKNIFDYKNVTMMVLGVISTILSCIIVYVIFLILMKDELLKYVPGINKIIQIGDSDE